MSNLYKTLVERYAPETVQAQLREIDTCRKVEAEARGQRKDHEQAILAELAREKRRNPPVVELLTA